MRRRVQCVPPKPMVISVDNNGGQGAWLRLFIEVSFPLHHTLAAACELLCTPACLQNRPGAAECPSLPGIPALCHLRTQQCEPAECTFTAPMLGGRPAERPAPALQQAGGMAAVKSVQVRTSGSQDTFQSLTNKWGSDWETPNAPKFPLDINIVGADGESVRRARHARLGRKTWISTYPFVNCMFLLPTDSQCGLTAGPPLPRRESADLASSLCYSYHGAG